MITTLFQQASALSPLEAAAVVLAILYLILAIRQDIGCWPCGFLYTAIYVYLSLDAKLYMQSALNAFYCAMAVYGWYCWHTGRVGDTGMPVTSWPLRRHLIAVAALILVGSANGYLLSFTDAAYPYADSLTAWGAIWTTFLVARKVVENWWYWLVIDCASLVIFWLQGLHLIALSFLIYITMIPFGLISWRRSMTEAPPQPA